jgi:hypothetical protein
VASIVSLTAAVGRERPPRRHSGQAAGGSGRDQNARAMSPPDRLSEGVACGDGAELTPLRLAAARSGSYRLDVLASAARTALPTPFLLSIFAPSPRGMTLRRRQIDANSWIFCGDSRRPSYESLEEQRKGRGACASSCGPKEAIRCNVLVERAVVRR